MNVLSLFDGMSCGRIALDRAGVKYDKYFASEVDKHAIKVAMANYPDTVQLGCVKGVKAADLPKIDLLIGGSPCQGFSHVGKKLNFNDERSKLFFEFVRLLEECAPRRFLLENVVMKQQWQDVISGILGVQPLFIDSRLVSAQGRPRLYWTNIPDVTMPQDKNIKFSDISVDGWFAGAMRGRRLNAEGKRDDYNTAIKLCQYIECRKNDKTNCLTTVCKDNVAVERRVGRTPLADVKYRWLHPVEYERLQTVPDGYTSMVSDSHRRHMLGNGWTVDVVAHIFRHLDL